MSNDMKDGLGDGEVELSGKALLANPDSSSILHCPASMDSFLDEFLKSTRTCTHTHTCNPPGPAANHTHICFHTHTQIISSEEDDNPSSRDHSNSKSRRRPSGNREAVRKYRVKKKAHTAYLEEEVQKLRVLNRQLLKKLQGQAILEAETLRLRGLLVDLRGRIDSELGVFPFKKQSNPTTIFTEGDCRVQPIGVQCQTGTPCFHPQAGSSSQASIVGSHKLMESWKEGCQPAINDCQTNNNNGMADAEGLNVDTVETLA